jgi:hypothetical protein
MVEMTSRSRIMHGRDTGKLAPDPVQQQPPAQPALWPRKSTYRFSPAPDAAVSMLKMLLDG